jgi:HEAT repeat protein
MEPETADPIEVIQRALTTGLDISRESVEGLSGLGGPIYDRFREMWKGLPDGDREALLDAVGEAGEENLVLDFMPIYELAIQDPDDTVRELGLRLASEEARPDLLDIYLRAAVADPDPDIRVAAIEELSAYTLTAQVDDWPMDLQQKMEQALVGIIHLPGAEANVRKAALLSLSYLTTPQIEVEIRQAHLQPDLRETAIEAMGRNCQEIWIPDIQAELQDDDPRRRIVAAQAAAELDDLEMVPYIVRLLRDDDEDVKVAAIEALGAIGGDDAKSVLSDLLQSRNRTLREAAKDAMQELTESEDAMGGVSH